MKNTPKTKLFTLGLVAVCFISTTQAALVNYDMDQLTYGDLTSFDTTLTFPDPNYDNGILVVTDPSDGVGRMDRLYFRYAAANNSKIQPFAGLVYAESGNVGFIGEDVLNTDNGITGALWNNGAGSAYYLPANGEIAWFARTATDANPWSNNTSFNDIAFGVRLTDKGTIGQVDAGDVVELVGIVYSTGSDSVFGKTANQLTAVIPEPSSFGLLLGLSAMAVIARRRAWD